MSWNKNEIKEEFEEELKELDTANDVEVVVSKLAIKYNLTREDVLNITLSE